MPIAPNLDKFLFCLLCFIIVSCSLYSQKNYVKGVVTDTAGKRKLNHSIVALIDLADSTLSISVRTNEEGVFEIEKISPGRYLMMISYPKMADYLKEMIIQDTSKINIGKIDMVTEAALLQEVIVTAGVPIRMRGDTLEYTADSFAVRPGANVEELLKRLPGIQVQQGGKIIAQGQEVKKILVDGDEFFADDPSLATKYLNADAIDKVQVFDKKSEQAEFTGIDDGAKTKTINLKLKKDKKNGYFGKISTGSDLKNYYNHDAMAALFNGGLKVAAFGLASKTGNTSINGNELTKYVAQDYEMIDDGTGNIYYTSSYENENYYGNGLPVVLYGGAHYSNKWKNNQQKLFTNYRTKQINADGWINNKGITTLPDGTGFRNTSDSKENSHSFEQSASGSFTTQLDSFSTVKISVNARAANGNIYTTRNSESKNEKDFFVNRSSQLTDNSFDNKNWGSNINYQHKFRKPGRTFSLVLQQDYNNKHSDNLNFSSNQYYDPSSGSFKNADTLDQLQKSNTLQQSYATKAVYTDKLSKKIGMSVDYGFKLASSSNTFETFNKSNNKYADLVDTLSSDYDFRVITNILGSSMSFNTKKMNINIGGKTFFTGFKQANNTLDSDVKRNFINVAPQISSNFRLKENTSFSVNYSGQTTQPSVEQLQPLRRSSNPLYTQIGNPDLKQGFRHNASLNYNSYNWINGKSFYGYFSVTYSDNNVTTKTTTNSQNKTVSQYINLDGVVMWYGSMTYSKEYKKLHLRPTIDLNFSRSGNYALLNDVKLKNENLNLNSWFSLRYDLPDKLAITYRAEVTYRTGKSNIATNPVSRIWSHSHNISVKGFLPGKFEISSDANFNFQPKNKSFNTDLNIIKWNGYLEKKLLKDDRGFIKLSVNDILDSNTGYSRTVYGNNISESDRFVIKRYWLLTLGWNFSNSIK